MLVLCKNTPGMDGSTSINGGVTLISGSGIRVGDSITLFNGARSWRISVPNSKQSAQNSLVIEVKQGVRYIRVQEFIIADTV